MSRCLMSVHVLLVYVLFKVKTNWGYNAPFSFYTATVSTNVSHDCFTDIQIDVIEKSLPREYFSLYSVILPILLFFY